MRSSNNIATCTINSDPLDAVNVAAGWNIGRYDFEETEFSKKKP